MANIDTAKPWFETGDYPTQAQFYQLFDWLRWKDEALAIGDITGLQTILNSIATIAAMKALYRATFNLVADGQWQQDAGVVVTGMVLESESLASLRVGTSAGADDILNIDLAAAVPVAVSLIEHTKTVRQLYFSGITGSTDVIILKNPA